MDKFSKNKYERIDLNEITEGDNIAKLGNNKEISFRDLANFLYDIKDGKINDFNKETEKQNLANLQDFMKNILIC